MAVLHRVGMIRPPRAEPLLLYQDEIRRVLDKRGIETYFDCNLVEWKDGSVSRELAMPANARRRIVRSYMVDVLAWHGTFANTFAVEITRPGHPGVRRTAFLKRHRIPLVVVDMAGIDRAGESIESYLTRRAPGVLEERPA